MAEVLSIVAVALSGASLLVLLVVLVLVIIYGNKLYTRVKEITQPINLAKTATSATKNVLSDVAQFVKNVRK